VSPLEGLSANAGRNKMQGEVDLPKDSSKFLEHSN